MAQKPSDYTLQLLGTSSEKSLRRFIKNAELTEDMAFFEGDVSGKPWVTLIYGRYIDRAGAERASRHVHELAPAIKPWIRTMAEIQKRVTGISAAHTGAADSSTVEAALAGKEKASTVKPNPHDAGRDSPEQAAEPLASPEDDHGQH